MVGGHLCGTYRAHNTAEIQDIRLDDIHSIHANHASPLGQVIVLFAAGHIHIQSLCHLRSPFQFPVGAGFLKPVVIVVLEYTSYFNGLIRGIAAIAIHQQSNIITQAFTNHGDESLSPSR